jgi:hypothetical protein
MFVPNTCLVKIGSAEGWGHPTRLISCGGRQCWQNVCKGVMGDNRDNTKKVEDIGNSIEGCWKYPKLMIFFFGLSYRFPGALTHSWRFFMLQLFSFYFFVFGSNPYHFINNGGWKGHWDSCREVRHHAIGDYNFLTQKDFSSHNP